MFEPPEIFIVFEPEFSLEPSLLTLFFVLVILMVLVAFIVGIIINYFFINKTISLKAKLISIALFFCWWSISVFGKYYP